MRRIQPVKFLNGVTASLKHRLAECFSAVNSIPSRFLSSKEPTVTSGLRIANATLVVTGREADKNTPCGSALQCLLGEEKPLVVVTSASNRGIDLIGDHRIYLSSSGDNRPDLYAEISAALSGSSISRILCVPFSDSQLKSAIAAADITGAPLALYFMDSLIARYGGSLEFMLREAINKSRLCLAATEKLRAYYQKRYGHKIWLLPPLAPKFVFPSEGAGIDQCPNLKGIVIGDVTDADSLEKLVNMVQESGVTFTWYRSSKGIPLSSAVDLAKYGITLALDSSQETVARGIRGANLAVILGRLKKTSESEDRFSSIKELSSLSFVLTAAAIPVILIQTAENEASRLVDAYKLGSCVLPGESLRSIITKLAAPESRCIIIESAKALARALSATNLAKLIWDSLEKGMMLDQRFEKALLPTRDKLTPYVDFESPREVHWEFRPLYQALMRIRATAYSPAFVFDVGASTGYWSCIAQMVFSESRFYCVDPLIEKYLEKEGEVYRLHPEFTKIAAAVGNACGEIALRVSEDLYGSTLFDSSAFPDDRKFTSVNVPLRTVDEIAQTEKIEGHGILKMDAQYSEHLVLEGANEFLSHIDFIVTEVSLERFTPELMIFDEFVSFLKERGFSYYDRAGDWRDPVTGKLLQQDLIFVRRK